MRVKDAKTYIRNLERQVLAKDRQLDIAAEKIINLTNENMELVREIERMSK